MLNSLPVIHTDGVIFKENKVLLSKRKIDPCKGSWCLPGGRVEFGETLEEAIIREIKEETNLAVEKVRLVGIYDDPNRDPIGRHIISACYILKAIDGSRNFRINKEVSRLKLFPLDKLPDFIAFDHKKMIWEALKIANPWLFDRFYFEHGLENGISLYSNYRWLPSRYFSLAKALIDLAKIEKSNTILDFGCAKGYLVRIFRELGFSCWGCDSSRYAIEHVDPLIKKYCFIISNDEMILPNEKYDFCISKDVLEHISKNDIGYVLKTLRTHVNTLIAVIPLGERGDYLIPEYHKDITHEIAEDADWWSEQFKNSGWNSIEIKYRVPGIKDTWSFKEFGNGIFIAR